MLQIRLMEEMPDQDPTLNKACPTPSATIRCAPRLEFELRHWWSQRGAGLPSQKLFFCAATPQHRDCGCAGAGIERALYFNPVHARRLGVSPDDNAVLPKPVQHPRQRCFPPLPCGALPITLRFAVFDLW